MRSNKKFGLVCLAGFIMSVHFASISYVNSSFLKQFVGDGAISLLYVAGSFLSIALFAFAVLWLRRHGSVLVLAAFAGLEILAVLGMALADSAALALAAFLTHISLYPLLYFCLDVHLEDETREENTTGRKRGVFLTTANAAWIIAPMALTFLVAPNDFSGIYFAAATALLPLIFLVVIFFKNTKRASARSANIILALMSLRKGGDKARVIGAQFMLYFFYAWMIIYLPLLLNREIGFSWDDIGFILSIMLLPFVIFQLPTGFLADKKLGEKELLITGFIIMFISTLAMPMLSMPAFWLWALVLFATRIGASIVEASSEIYFFKHVKEDDTALISLFRMVRPISLIIAPLISIPIIHYFSYSTSLYFLAFFVLCGLFFIPKVDTK